MTDRDKRSFHKLKKQYYEIEIIVLTSFSTYSTKFASEDKQRVRLLLSDSLNAINISKLNIPTEIINEGGYLEFLQKTIAFGEGGSLLSGNQETNMAVFR